MAADNRQLCYFEICVQDKDGNLVAAEKREIFCEVFGGELLGIFSGNPKNEDQYGAAKCHLFGGRALAVVRCSRNSKLNIRVSAEGLKGGVSETVLAKN